MADKTGAARLRQAIENQASAGEATAICDECEDELARVAENLRSLTIGHFIQYKKQFFDELAEVVLGFEDFHDFNTVLEKLADLIDPEEADRD